MTSLEALDTVVSELNPTYFGTMQPREPLHFFLFPKLLGVCVCMCLCVCVYTLMCLV